MPQIPKELVTIRGPRPEDHNFIMSTWLKGMRYGNDWFEAIDKDAYYSVYHQAVQRVLERPDTLIAVACLKDDPEVILGYSVCRQGSTPDIDVHFVFVKAAWRKSGIARSLIPKKFKTVTHLTKVAQSILRKYPAVKFNPFAF